jgi:hypothetical protein
MEESNKDFDPTQPSRGLGDTVAKITHYTGISKLSEVLSKALNIEDCGCSRRQESLNNFISYPPSKKPAEEGEYEVLQNIKINSNEYKIEDIINITQDHPLYKMLNHYIEIGVLIKSKNAS